MERPVTFINLIFPKFVENRKTGAELVQAASQPFNIPESFQRLEELGVPETEELRKLWQEHLDAHQDFINNLKPDGKINSRRKKEVRDNAQIEVSEQKSLEQLTQDLLYFYGHTSACDTLEDRRTIGLAYWEQNIRLKMQNSNFNFFAVITETITNVSHQSAIATVKTLRALENFYLDIK